MRAVPGGWRVQHYGADGGEEVFGALELVEGIRDVILWEGVAPVCGALAGGVGGEGEVAVVGVGDVEKGAEAKAECGEGKVEVVLDEVGVKGVGGARAAEGVEANMVEG